MNKPCNQYCNNNYYQKQKCCNFTQKKENTINSLFEVEHFLCRCQKALKCLKLYSLFK